MLPSDGWQRKPKPSYTRQGQETDQRMIGSYIVDVRNQATYNFILSYRSTKCREIGEAYDQQWTVKIG